jgi:hypothetical protein
MTEFHEPFDRSGLNLSPIGERNHKIGLRHILPLTPVDTVHPVMETVGMKIVDAIQRKASVSLSMGAHVLRAGVQSYLIDMMARGFLSCIALNGAGVIHDFEFALAGGTTESVADYIKDGRFGFWRETAQINDIVSRAAEDGAGLGYAVGKFIEEENLPHRDISILAAGYRFNIPVTVHVGIGYDIVYQYPNCDGAAYGATSYRDFLTYTRIMENLEGGVVMNFGSAVMGPEIYLKSLSMVRNKARQEGRTISRFTTLVCDLVDLPRDVRLEPSPESSKYYFRPWKTMLARTVAGQGESHYLRERHEKTIPQLWTTLVHP